MAIALLGHGGTSRSEDSSSDLTLSYTSHNGTYRKMIVVITTVAATAATKVAGVKYNNVSLTVIDLNASADTHVQMDSSTTYKNMHAYYLDEADFPAAGAHNLVADVSSTVTSIIMELIEISGGEQGTPVFALNDVALDTVNEMQVATTLDNTWLISGFWDRNGAAHTPTSGQTEVEDIGLGSTEDNGLSLSYHCITPPNATADSNWSIVNSVSNYQICIIVPPAIIPNRNSAILSATF